MNTSVIKWVATGDTVLVAGLTALASTGVLTGTAAAVVGGLIAIGTALGGYLAHRSIKAQAKRLGLKS